MFVLKKKYDALVEDYNDLLAVLKVVEGERNQAGRTNEYRAKLDELNRYWDETLKAGAGND